MSETSPIAALHELAWTVTPLPRCAERDHGSGHLCLPSPDHADLTGLVRTITDWYGQPTIVDAESSHPLVAPFTEGTQTVVRMHAWPCNRRWVGCGITRSGDEDRMVLLLADRTTPAAQTLPEGSSWVERLLAVTGWAEARHRPAPYAVDWTAVEQRLGIALPNDYKQMAEAFGCGAFNAYLQIHVPDAQPISYDLVRTAEHLVELAREHPTNLYAPYSIYPAQGGLLKWASTQQSHSAFWLTEGPDPNRWPIMTIDDAHDKWVRFDSTASEFIFRMLTDPLLPFLHAESQDTPWFTRIGPR